MVDFASKLIHKLTREEKVRLEDILVELYDDEDEDDTMDQEELYEG